MGSMTSINFVVLINGALYIFIKASRGIRWDVPFLFLLIVEVLRRMILKAQSEGLR